MFILGYKNTGETTQEFSNRIKAIHNADYAAVCGKLDPMARGITKVLLNENRKLMDNYLQSIKTYTFNIMIGIKTSTDDILGEIQDVSNSSDYYEKVICYLINNISNQKIQKFHPYSAKRITIDNVRKPLHYFSRRNLTTHSNLPEKKVNVYNMSILDPNNIDFGFYRNQVLTNINMISKKNRELFNVDNITKLWESIEYHKEIMSIKVTMEVSSGYYIRMIPYYLYRDLGIPSHIYDIQRIST